MSNSHPLHPFFTPFEPVAHPLQAVVLAMVPFFFPTVSEAVHSDWSVHLLRGPERPARHLQNLQQAVAAGCKHSDRRLAIQYGHERRYPGGRGPVWNGRIGGGGGEF